MEQKIYCGGQIKKYYRGELSGILIEFANDFKGFVVKTNSEEFVNLTGNRRNSIRIYIGLNNEGEKTMFDQLNRMKPLEDNEQNELNFRDLDRLLIQPYFLK